MTIFDMSKSEACIYLVLITCSPTLDTHAEQFAAPAFLDLHHAVLRPAVIAEDMPAPHICGLSSRHITEAALACHFIS